MAPVIGIPNSRKTEIIIFDFVISPFILFEFWLEKDLRSKRKTRFTKKKRLKNVLKKSEFEGAGSFDAQLSCLKISCSKNHPFFITILYPEEH